MRLSKPEHFAQLRANRDRVILDAAIEEALAEGYQWITREAVAARAGVSVGTINTAYGRMVELKRAVMRAAVERGLAPIVAQGLAEGSSIAQAASPEIKKQAAALLA